MNRQDFAELKAAVVEVGLIQRGEVAPSREFRAGAGRRHPLPTVWALCLVADEALTPGKIYAGQVSRNGTHIGLTDDAGEHFGCPLEWFVLLDLPREVETRLHAALRQAA